MKRRRDVFESECKEVPKKLKSKKCDGKDVDIEPEWQDFELLSQETCINTQTAKSLVTLFEDGNTIPFIARYRRNIIGDLSPEELRTVKDHYEDICCLKSKLKTVVKTIEKSGNLNDDIKKSLSAVRSFEELEHVYAPFKPESKRSLSERAKALGLNEIAHNILNNTCKEDLVCYVNPNKEGLKTIKDVEKGVIHIIASVLASDTDILGHVRELRVKCYFIIETKKSTNKKETKVVKKDVTMKSVDESKYQLYFDFRVNSNNIKPHQVLAINRGENQKVLSVKINVPDLIFNSFQQFCWNKYLKSSHHSDRNGIISEAIKDCYTRLLQPLLVREVRSMLKQMAEKASMEIFSKNLKQLLLATPIKGKLILGIDPGYSNGCKLALISETGMLINYNVIYPFKNAKGAKDEAVNILRKMLRDNKCELIAVGNGTACRETETWLSELISENVFSPLKVSYTIVNEDGASIYSCSSEAKKEFPKLDPNIISAVSLARRIQEPLAELVKVEPQHLGVGMYQHDLRKKQLSEALNEVVSECVSFVGVDLNTASQCLLKSIAGLSEKKAAQIIQYREENGPFTYRRELLKIKGIGDKILQQCAGFLRIGPINLQEEESFYTLPNATKLDRTIIHPESYDVARKILKEWKLKEEYLGKNEFIEKIKSFSSKSNPTELATKFKADLESVKLILDAFGKPLNHDLRTEHNITPLFKKGLTSIDDLSVGTTLSGRVSNVTSFGCFVDIGVHVNGLIHVSKLRGFELQIGDRVEVEVLNIEKERKRIGLKFLGMTLA